jgi:hypothetical protein
VLKKGGWIKGAIKKPGALKQVSWVWQKTSLSLLKNLPLRPRSSGKLGQRARLAQTLKGFKK